ncbi:MAG TPA: DUF5777 family beta-barrel protein [Thermoanaerobaculia bacterium]|nr:DUF5777 family beta-barrel protein [Thermoanaerobaculia bacterium]
MRVPIAALAVFLAGSLAAQESPYEPLRRDPLGTQLINVPTPYPVRARTLEVVFIHRFHLPINDGSSADLWGLDSGADIGLGLAWGITSHLDVSLLRSSFQEDFELAGKFLFLEQAPRIPLTLAVRAGVDRLERDGIEDPTRPFAQLLLARRFGRGFNLLLSPSWVRDTPRLRDAFNVPVGLTLMLPRETLLELEVVPENRDLDESETAWHVALSKDLGGHIFEVILGNSRAVTVNQYLGGDSAAGFEAGDVRLGFNLIRDFDF